MENKYTWRPANNNPLKPKKKKNRLRTDLNCREPYYSWGLLFHNEYRKKNPKAPPFAGKINLLGDTFSITGGQVENGAKWILKAWQLNMYFTAYYSTKHPDLLPAWIGRFKYKEEEAFIIIRKSWRLDKNDVWTIQVSFDNDALSEKCKLIWEVRNREKIKKNIYYRDRKMHEDFLKRIELPF